MNASPLHVAYRPDSLDDVIGQDHVVDSLRGFEEEESWPHAFLFSGPSGTGKTTIARIISLMLKAEVIEVDAATYSGVGDVRRLTETLRYKPMDLRNPNRVFILDECHSFSRQAWEALLKVTEDTPKHGYFVLCTTVPAKVPKTIKTRCHHYDLKPVPEKQIIELLDYVCDQEEIGLGNEATVEIAEASEGSPRQALVFLSQARNVDAKELKKILASPGQDPEVVEFCRALLKGTNWNTAISYVRSFEKTYPAETVRIIMVNYFQKVVLSKKNLRDAESALAILDAFSGEWPQTDKYAPMLLALGDLFS